MVENYVYSRLIQIRKDYLKLSQIEVAEQLNIAQSMLSKLEAGMSFTSLLDLLIFYVKNFNVDANWVLLKDNRGLEVFRVRDNLVFDESLLLEEELKIESERTFDVDIVV